MTGGKRSCPGTGPANPIILIDSEATYKLTGGRIADRYGTRRVLVLGLVGFAVASGVGGAAVGGEMLFLARALQGVCAALIAPAALSILSRTYTAPAERGIAFGVYGALSSGGAAVGLLAGGVLTELLDWRWCLYVNIPIAVAAIIGALVTIPRIPPHDRVRLDIPGAALSCSGLTTIVLGFTQAEARGWIDPLVLILLGAGGLLLVGFVAVQSRVPQPLLPLRIITDRTRAGAFVSVAFSQVSLFGFFLFITFYMQTILGYSPIVAGLAFLPLTAATAIGAGVIGARLLPRMGPRPLIVFGLLIAAAGMGYLTLLQADTPICISPHYLKGTVFCGQCGSRLLVCNSKNRHGNIYPYFVCAAKHSGRGNCTRQAMLIEEVEQLVERHYETVQISAQTRQAVAEHLHSQFDALMASESDALADLTKERTRLEDERGKLLQAHYAGAIPLDLLKEEQHRISAGLETITNRIEAHHDEYADARNNLDDSLNLLEHAADIYARCDDANRRLCNQAFFTAIYIEEDGEVRVGYAWPFDALTSREVQADALTWAENAQNKYEVRTPTKGGSSVKGSHLAHSG